MAKSNKIETNKKVISLVSESHRDKIREMSEILNKSMSAVNEEAIAKYYNIVMYSPEQFNKFIKRNPRLSLYYEIIKKAFKEPCCINLLKQIMLLDKNDEGKIFFTTFILENNPNKLKDYVNENTESVVLAIQSHPDTITDEIGDNLSKTLSDIEGDGTFALHSMIDQNMPKDKIKIFLFIVYKDKKKIKKNDNEQKKENGENEEIEN